MSKMSNLDGIFIFLSIMTVLGLIIGAVVSNVNESHEAELKCHPNRVKHYFVDPDTHKVRAVCAGSPEDTLR